jgi:uncharacterized protein (TIGR02391 family)
MGKLSVPNKIFLEGVLGMGGGYVLDFSNASFADFFGDLDIDIYDEQQYPGSGDSKANRMRALWKSGSDVEVSASLAALADYVEARKAAPGSSGFSGEDITDDQINRMRKIATGLNSVPAAGAVPTVTATHTDPALAIFTTEATVSKNKIEIEIHEDIYNHIGQYLATGDYFHAVEESYKLVRGKLREITGKEKATEAFAAANIEKLFGQQPTSEPERDFFEGVKFLNMAIQFLRNEKAHTPATPLERNLAVHYISLASLSYDLITRYVSEETIRAIEDAVRDKRHSYPSASAFYRDFDGGKWLRALNVPVNITSSAVRKVLKNKWLDEADFTRSYDHSNIVLMRLELVVDELTQADLDRLLELPTQDSYGNDQSAGMLPFLEFVQQQQPGRLSRKAKERIAKET